MRKTNAKLKEGFTQVCVWEATLVGKKNIAEFEQYLLDETGARVQYLEEITTTAGLGGEGGRNDVLFAVHDEDVNKFAVPRLGFGIRWLEDAWPRNSAIYPDRVAEYKCWSTSDGSEGEDE